MRALIRGVGAAVQLHIRPMSWPYRESAGTLLSGERRPTAHYRQKCKRSLARSFSAENHLQRRFRGIGRACFDDPGTIAIVTKLNQSVVVFRPTSVSLGPWLGTLARQIKSSSQKIATNYTRIG
jgi:hypothetical protein